MERRRAAVFIADVAGYSRLVEAFEDATHQRLQSLRERVLNPALEANGAEVIRRTGDGLLAIFTDPATAVACAVAVQEGAYLSEAGVPPEQALRFRIGISYGELLFEGDDIFGNEVNVAARLEQIAEPGGILISGSAQALLEGDPAAPKLIDLGPQALKNMFRPVQAFLVPLTHETGRPRSSAATLGRPSIAVMPFRVPPAQSELQYLGDGLVEDIVAALAAIRELKVISRNSTLQLRDDLNPRSVGEKLGVRYLLSGSLRQFGTSRRIVAELADTANETVLWAQRYDFAAAELYEVQDRITGVIVNTLTPQIREAEVGHVMRKRPERLTAYDHYLQGLSLMYRLQRSEFMQAGTLLRRAIALDDSFAAPYALAAEWHSLRVGQGWSPDPGKDGQESIRLAEAAIDRDGNDALALATLGHHRSFLSREYDTAIALFDRALAASPGHARAWALSAPTFNYIGEPDAALGRAQQALTLSPVDPLAFWCRTSICIAYYTRGDYDAAAGAARLALADNPRYVVIWRMLAAACASGGRGAEARRAAERVMSLEPDFRAGAYAASYPYRDAMLRGRLRRDLVAAGLPD